MSTWMVSTFMMISTIAFLVGCTGTGSHETGRLECVGYCELILENRHVTIRTEKGDKVTVEEDESGGFKTVDDTLPK